MGQSTLNLVLHEMLFFLCSHISNPNTHALAVSFAFTLYSSSCSKNVSAEIEPVHSNKSDRGTFFLVIFCCCYFVFFHAHLNIVIILNIYCLLPAGISSQRPCKGQGSREQMQRRVIKSSLMHCMPPVLFFMRHLMLSWNAIHARSRAYSTPSCLFTIKIK